jgi:hypothetical protein
LAEGHSFECWCCVVEEDREIVEFGVEMDKGEVGRACLASYAGGVGRGCVPIGVDRVSR